MSKKTTNSSAQQQGGGAGRNDGVQLGQAPKPNTSGAKAAAAVAGGVGSDSGAGKSDQRQQSSSASSSSIPSPSLSPRSSQQGPKNGSQAKNHQHGSAKTKTSASDVISKRLRAARKKLQRAVSSEQKTGSVSSEPRESGSDAPAAEAETMGAKVATLRAIVRELEDLQKAVGGADSAERRGWNNALASEDEVHRQTLRLVYAVTRCEMPADDAQRTAVEAFFEAVLAEAKGESAAGAVFDDEKLSMSRNSTPAATVHLRRLAQRDRAAIAGIGGQATGAVTYKELAGIIDQMLAPRARSQAPGIDAKADAPPLSSEGAVQTGEDRSVDIPRPSSLFVGDGNSDSEDFNTTVVVPPGGLTFIASAELVDGSDAEDSDNAPAFQPLGASSEQSETKDTNAAVPSVIFPVPQSPSNASSAIITGIERAGGFAISPALPPVGGVHPSVLQQSGSDNASAGPTEMPAPAHGPANIMGSDAPPAGFSVYSAHHAGAAPAWLSAATGAQGPAAAAGATTGIPSMPGVYGMMPMHHFVPHLAMQYGGFFPPHMFGMPEMSPVAGSGSEGGLQPSGSGDGRSGAKDDQQQQQLSGTAEAMPATIQQQQQQQQQMIGGAMLGMPMDGSMWQAPPAPVQPQAAGGSLGSSTPNPPMLAGMASSESLYQHAMAAAAAGFSMAAPFMYPHADATTLSTAATGGSDNNDSINSLDSASNRGGSSRPSSIHHYTQYSGSDAGSRGLAAQGANIAEYVPVTQYMWPQQPGGDPKHAHHHQQQHHQLQQQQQQQHGSFVYPPPPPQQQHQHQQHYPGGHAGSGSHRGKDSGSTHGGSTTSGNSNSNSHTGSAGSGHYHHHHHYSYQRDRRGNNNNSGSNNSGGSGEYQRQRRWNNNNSNSNSNSSNSGGYSRQHHQPHNSAVAVAAAQAAASNASAVSSYPAGGSQGQNETAVSFGTASGEAPPSAVASANNPGSAQSGASYYGSAFVRQ